MGITGAWLGCGGHHPLQEVFGEFSVLPGAQNLILGDGSCQLLLLSEKHKSLSCNRPRARSTGMGMAGIVNTPGGRRERNCTSAT